MVESSGAMQSLQELVPGRYLGRYELLMPVAQGGMAAVWAARLRGSRGFQKVVAIKTILPVLSDDPRFEQMFLDEAGLASRIRHPNVAQVLDLGEENRLLYQVMEWIDGMPLNALVRDAKTGCGLPHPVAAKIMIGVCEGLHAAHEMRNDAGVFVGLVHRDVSPQNVLVSIDGVPKVVDFGVAKATSLMNTRTATGTFKGKPPYMAPEQILGGQVSRRADIFALGVVLYVATTGRHPFRGDSDMATLHRICEDRPPLRPSEVYPGYPSRLENVVMRAIDKLASRRFATAAEMARAIQLAVPDVQNTGDTEVAECVQQLAGEFLKSRNARLLRALAEADARASMPSLHPPSSPPSHPPDDANAIPVVAPTTPPTSTVPVELHKSSPSHPAPSADTLTAALATPPAPPTTPDEQSARSRIGWIAAGVGASLSLSVVAVSVGWAVRDRRSSIEDTPVLATDSCVPAAGACVTAPTASASIAAPQDAAAAASDVDAAWEDVGVTAFDELPKASVAAPLRARNKQRESAPSSPPVLAPQDNVPAIRDPGF
jgi:eukaryotic-like serine/threonine-protein kinase